MTNRKTLRFVLATFLMFGTTVALYEWNQSVSDQQAQTTGTVELHKQSDATKSN